MNVIRMTAKSDADGVLRLQLPVGAGEFEVAVVLSPKVAANGKPQTPEERGWPVGYFEKTYGSITDETFVAPPRGPVRPVEAIE